MTDPGRGQANGRLAVAEHPGTAGGGPLVVLVHGSMDRSTSFAKVLRHLGDLDVVRYDRRGYGRSVEAGTVGLDGHVDDLLEVVGGRAAILGGHSLGGVVALVAAQRRPDLIRAVVTYEAPMPWVDWWPRRSAGGDAMASVAAGGEADAAERFMRRMLGDERWERLPPSTRAARRAEGRALVAELASVRSGAPPYDATSLSLPVVSGLGSDSKEHHRWAATELARTVPGAELVLVDGAGHGAHASHPAAFADLVRRGIARLDD